MDHGHESHHAFEMLSQHFEDLSKSLVTMTYFLISQHRLKNRIDQPIGRLVGSYRITLQMNGDEVDEVRRQGVAQAGGHGSLKAQCTVQIENVAQ